MKTFMKALLIFLGLAGLCAAYPLLTSETNAPPQELAQLPPELENLLKNADTFTLFSISPVGDFQNTSTNKFQNHNIFGQLDVKSDTRTELLAALKNGIAERSQPGMTFNFPDCFNPRHGIRATKGGETVEFLICFECMQIQASSNQGKSWLFMTSKTPATVFNRVLKEANVPLPEY